MSEIDPITVYHFDSDKFDVRAELVYPDSVLNEMARRVGDKLDEEILARLGYVKPVRCKECKYCMSYWESDYCDYFSHVTNDPDGFCAWGERKEGTE